VTLGVALGLFLGKALGITLFSWLGVRLGFASLPKRVQWRHILGVGFLGGIGFTMSLFIAGLAFTDVELNTGAKLGILLGSLLSGIVGAVLISKVRTAHPQPSVETE
jgi:NhaA family Na+:H+ antiporter